MRRYLKTQEDGGEPERPDVRRLSDWVKQDSPWLPGEEMPVGHGSYFYYAHKEGLLAENNANIVSFLSAVN